MSTRGPTMGVGLRPVLDHRMPTLSSTAFLPLLHNNMSSVRTGLAQTALQRLETRPPRSLKDVRSILETEIKVITKKLARLERSYYGVGKTIQQEVEKYVTPLKSFMRMIGYRELSSAAVIENSIKVGSDPKRYKGDQANVTMLKEVTAKLHTYVPKKFSGIADHCLKVLDAFEKYCVSFYDPEKDGYLETAAHYEEQIRAWTSTIKTNLENIEKIYERFKSRGLHFSLFCSPVAAFCQRFDCELLPFLVIFADACTNVRSVLSIMTSWIKADENYAVFLRNDIDTLENTMDEKIKLMRDAQQRYHGAIFKQNQAEIDCSKLMLEVEGLKEKREAMVIEKEYLLSLSNELQLDLEFKERRRDDLKKKATEMDVDEYTVKFESVTEEIKYIKERLPVVRRQLTGVKMRLDYIREKRACLEKVLEELKLYTFELKESNEEQKTREIDYTDSDKSLEIARKLYLYKTSNDSVEKIYYSLPIAGRGGKLPFLTPRDEDPFEKSCKVVCEQIDQDWPNLYRNLPFYPTRGSQTIEKDISSLNQEWGRGPLEELVEKALCRWRRHHTRAKPEDLVETLKKIKRPEVMRNVEDTINPPIIEERDEDEDIPPGITPELVPYWRMGERFDQLRAANRI